MARRKHRENTFYRGNIRGAREAVMKLRAMGEDVLEAAKFALKEGVDMIVEEAKSRCPVETGKLRNSIKAKALSKGTVYKLSANAKNAQGIVYGQFVEFSPKINKPFLYPAIEANIGEVKSNIKRAVQDAIKYGVGYGNSAA